jgi:hypothetical protein
MAKVKEMFDNKFYNAFLKDIPLVRNKRDIEVAEFVFRQDPFINKNKR